MSRELVAVYNQKAVEHRPPFDIYNGQQFPSFDVPQRALEIISALQTLRAEGEITLLGPTEFGVPFIYSVHDEAYIDYLKRTSERVAQKPPILVAEIDDPIQRTAVVREYPAFAYPSVFPHGLNPRSHNRVSDRGRYSFDTATPVMGNTYDTALNAAFCALTAADVIIQGSPLSYALCRPGGHHAERDRMGGYCYINHSALAADYLQQQTGTNVAVLDIDAHHGNGTQDIFYTSEKVNTVSIHGDPTEKSPYYSGFEDERGQGSGFGHNLNIPLPIGTADEGFLNAVNTALAHLQQTNPQYLVVTLGFDGHREDPCEVFNLSTAVYAEVARRISQLNIPTLSVQSGGYAIDKLGLNIATYLKALTEEQP